MSTHINSADDLFQNKEEQEKGGVVTAGDSAYENESTRQAGAAQKSARPRKSATAFRTISEVADDLGVQQHVLRFWETKFSQVKPLKRGGGRRYYRPEDVRLLQAIHCLLYVEGYTIKGVQKLLREVGKKKIVATFSGEASKDGASLHRDVGVTTEMVEKSAPKIQNHSLDDAQRDVLQSVLAELKDLRGMIKKRN